MTVKIGMHMLAMLAVLALAVPAAHAGRGMGGGEIAVYDCYSIAGANPPRVVTLTDVSGNVQQNVHINGGKLLCTIATMTKQEGDPDFDNVPGEAADLKCYQVATPGPRNTPPSVQIFDPIIGGTEATDGEVAKVVQGRYVCTFAVTVVPTP